LLLRLRELRHPVILRAECVLQGLKPPLDIGLSLSLYLASGGLGLSILLRDNVGRRLASRLLNLRRFLVSPNHLNLTLSLG
jgi:hypothetical protein